MHILQFTTEGESIYKDTQNARNTQITLCRWKESGTCPSGTDEPPGKATFNAALRCKIVDVLPADIRKSGHGQQSVAPLATLAPQLPAHRAGLSPTKGAGYVGVGHEAVDVSGNALRTAGEGLEMMKREGLRVCSLEAEVEFNAEWCRSNVLC